MENQNIKPILFNTEMVQAILAGRKTQTRRISKDQPLFWQTINSYPDCFMIVGADYDCEIYPKYNISDILWVRETFQESECFDFNIKNKFVYKANESDANFAEEYKVKWKPSLFMPKEACRIFLKVTNVRCERLQDISEDDAEAEGVLIDDEGLFCWNYLNKKWSDITPKSSFESLWDSINLKKAPWESNRWVWAYDFEITEKPENFLL